MPVNETEKPSYYAIIPANVRYCKDLKYQERLFYGEITCLLNKEGYCFASNRYFANLYDVIPGTISRWISHLEKLGFIRQELIRDDKKQIIERRIFIKDSSTISQCNTYKQNCSYPYKQNSTYPMSRIAKDNIINIKIDRLFNYIIKNEGEIPKDFNDANQFIEFYNIIKKFELNYTKEVIDIFTDENINKIKIIIYCIKELFIRNKTEILTKITRKGLIDLYDNCKSLEQSYKNTDKEINNFFDYYYASVIKKFEAKYR